MCKNIPTVLRVIISSAYIRRNNNFRWESFSEKFWAGIIINVVYSFFKFMSNLGASDLYTKKMQFMKTDQSNSVFIELGINVKKSTIE